MSKNRTKPLASPYMLLSRGPKALRTRASADGRRTPATAQRRRWHVLLFSRPLSPLAPMQNRTEQPRKLGGGARARGETAEATSGETDERRPADGRAGRRKRTQRGERSAAGCDGRVARRVVQRPGGERVVVRRRGWSDPVGAGSVGPGPGEVSCSRGRESRSRLVAPE